MFWLKTFIERIIIKSIILNHIILLLAFVKVLIIILFSRSWCKKTIIITLFIHLQLLIGLFPFLFRFYWWQNHQNKLKSLTLLDTYLAHAISGNIHNQKIFLPIHVEKKSFSRTPPKIERSFFFWGCFFNFFIKIWCESLYGLWCT